MSWPSLDFKGKFHALSNSNREDKRGQLEEEGGVGVHAKERNPGTVPTAEVTATAPTWFMMRAQKPAGEEVSVWLLLPLC